MSIKKNYYELTLDDGRVVLCTLNYASLYKLRAKNPKVYSMYNAFTKKKEPDELDMVSIIYVAYVCANVDDDFMTFEQFLEALPPDRVIIGELTQKLIAPSQKKTAFQPPSKKPHRR